MSYYIDYPFRATFKDGTKIDQAFPDVSTINPQKSSFYDVVQRQDELVKFRVGNDEENVTVDLLSGEIIVTGIQEKNIVLEEVAPVPKDARLHLMYFRRVKRFAAEQTGSQSPLAAPVEYHVGWQATVDGTNVQRIVAII